MKAWWDAQRFGLTPDKWLPRVSRTGPPPVLCVSIPKSGTHLLERALCLHPRYYRKLLLKRVNGRWMGTVSAYNVARWGGLEAILQRVRPGQVVLSHLHHSEERLAAARSQGVKTILMVRDPRDMAVSRAFYIDGETWHPQYAAFQACPDLPSKIQLSIEGNPATGLLSVGETYRAFAGWMQTDTLLVRFEDLIGTSGGGSNEQQIETLMKVFAFLGDPLPVDRVAAIARTVFSDISPTFRRGASGRWREYLDDRLAARFHETAGDMLQAYGYEADATWSQAAFGSPGRAHAN